MERLKVIDVFSLMYEEFIPGLVKPGLDFYKYIMETKSDTRTENWLLMSSPGPLSILLATYLYFCLWAGPNFMKDRKPYELKYVLIVYNLYQVVINAYIFSEHIYGGWGVNYSFLCQEIDFSDDPMAVRMASCVWWYFITKVVELLDTVFFLLRKKNSQVSFLHLYHHSMMPVCSWLVTKFFPGGHGTLLFLINSFVHVLTYSYYFITSLGPKFQKYLWWKRHLTQIQMIQFSILFVHNFLALVHRCEFSKIMNTILLLQTGLLFILLGKFYLRSYIFNDKLVPMVNMNFPNGHLKED